MKKGDLVRLRESVRLEKNESIIQRNIGLIVELQNRGPVPGAYVLWPVKDSTEWISIEKLIALNDCASFS